MTDRKFEITDARGGVALAVRVVTRSAETELVGAQVEGDLKVLKVRLKASPAGDPAANQELIGLLASLLSVPENKIEIVAGAGGREKVVTVEGVSSADVEAKLGGVKADE